MPAQINILSAGAVAPGLVNVIDAFRRETGHDVKVSFATAPELRKRLSGGEMADVVIAPPELLEAVASADKAASANRPTLGRIGVGVMVRAGAPLPKIATVEELRHSLLNAESIVFNQASTGIYIENLFKRLGIDAEVEAKITRYADFAAVRDRVANGQRIEIGFGATTVIIENAANGLRFVGPLPGEIQNYTTYTAALTANANEAARALLPYFATPTAKAIFAAAGIQ
jgi:molybdate transport system substrate-binding protein